MKKPLPGKTKLSLDHIKNQIRGSLNPIATLSELRSKVSRSDLIKLIEWLPSYHRNGRGIFQWQYPKRIADIRRKGVLGQVGVESEIVWAGHRLFQHASRIISFRILAQEFESELASGNYHNCPGLLDKIEKEFGVSLWIIENRIAILQLLEGIESQKAYAMMIRNARGANDLVSYSAFCISHRNENTVTVSHYMDQISSALDSVGVHPEIRSYLLFRTTNRMPQNQEEVSGLLRYEENSGIIDYYETFLSIAKWAITTGPDNLRQCFMSELRSLSSKVSDFRIKKALFIGGETDCLRDIQVLPLDVHDSYVAGHFEATKDLVQASRVVGDETPTIWLLEARARAEYGLPPRTEDTRLSTSIVNLARAVVMKTDGSDESIGMLAKIRLNFRLLNFASSLEVFLAEEVSSDPIPSSLSKGQLAFIDNPYLVPDVYRYLPRKEARKIYSRQMIDSCGPRPSLYLEFGRTADDTFPEFPAEVSASIGDEFLLEMKIERALMLADYDEALVLVGQLARAERETSQRKAVQLKCFALLKGGRIPELTESIVVSCLKDRRMIRNLPVRECAERLDRPMRALLRANLTTSILLDLYSRNVNDSLDSEKSFAYEDFLIAHGFERPSELVETVSDFPFDQLRYYLRNLCVLPVMERSAAFQGTRDLEDERLKVLALLAKLDPADSSQHSAEISEITRNQKIRQGVRHVEQSKISIDVQALQRWAHLNVKESFVRYKVFLAAGMGGGSEAVKDVIGDQQSEKVSLKEVPEVPKNEMIDLLAKMVYSLFRECTISPEHGLDCYLSIRIRHGTLFGQLRSPLEKEEIISQRESDSAEYKSNTPWMKRLGHLDYNIRTQIDRRLNEFSKDYDDFIDRIANELIQIKSNEKKEGLFVIAEEAGGRRQIRGIGIPRFAAFVLSIKEDTTFDAFLDMCFELFWESVEQCLKAIRDLIDSSLKEQVARLFTTLEKDIARIVGEGSTADLDHSIRVAKTGAQEILDRVKEWFRPPKPLATPELAFEDLVDIGLQIVRTMHPEFDPDISLVVPPELPLIEGGLEKFSDIFTIIFDNIQKHSGMGKRPNVEIELVNLGNKLKLAIRNEIAPGVRNTDSEAKIEAIKQLIAKGAYQSVVRSEGGSGLFKLRKVIGSDGGKPLLLDFVFGHDGRFCVDLEVGIRHIVEGEP